VAQRIAIFGGGMVPGLEELARRGVLLLISIVGQSIEVARAEHSESLTARAGTVVP
jgi:hypothetical protein